MAHFGLNGLRVLYVCKQPSTGNRDEAFITSALMKNRCLVTIVDEDKVKRRPEILTQLGEGQDILLFHKWSDPITLSRFTDRYPNCVTVCWYFDLVDCDDDTLSHRCRSRMRYLRSIESDCKYIMCTDGDWVARNISKYQVLRQGLGYHEVLPERDKVKKDVPILFTGISKGGGILRQSFVSLLSKYFKEKFLHIERGVHGPELANLIYRSKVVVCPDYPVTNSYWSNRIYHMAGHGGCVLHAESKGLRLEYHDKQIVFYKDREALLERIEHYLKPENEEERYELSLKAAEHTRENYLYDHRVGELLNRIKPSLLKG